MKGNPNRDKGPYNATVWRIQDGKVFSTQAARFVDGKIIAASGHWTSDNSLPEYHDGFLARMQWFGGEPVSVVVTETVNGMLDACTMPASDAFASHEKRTLAVFGERKIAMG